VASTSICYTCQASCEGFAQVLDWLITLEVEIINEESCHEDLDFEDQIPLELEQPHECIEEEDLNEAYHVEDQVHEEGPIENTPLHQDEILVFTPPFDGDEVTQDSISPSHKDKGMVSCIPFQVFDSYDASFNDLESEEFLEKPLDVVNFSSNEKRDDHVEDFLRVGMHKWDMSCFHFDGDPIYGIDDDSRIKNEELLPLEHTSTCINYSYFWQHEEDMITKLFQPPRSDSLQHSHDDFQSYPRRYDTYSFKHLELFGEEYFQLPLCSDLGEHPCEHSYEVVIIPGRLGFHNTNSQPPFSLSYSQNVIKDEVGDCVFGNELSMGQGCFQLMVCFMDFQPHIEGQQALSWEQNIFLRYEFTFYHS
jgi:hypothetical protein